MKFISLTQNLKTGVGITNHLTGKNLNLPILNNVMIELKDNKIKLISTDLEMGITHTLRGKIEKEGSITVNSKTLLDYINLLPNKKTSIEKDKLNLKIECDNYKTKIKGQSPEDFPIIPTIDKKNKYTVNLNEFKKALSSVIFAVSKSESKIELAGIFFQVTNDKLILASTDSFRLAEFIINIKNSNENKEEGKLIIPSKTIQELLRIISSINEDSEIKENSGEIDFYISDNQILFSTESTEIISRLIEGQYPDYKQIIPNKFTTKAILNKNELIRAIKASSLFSKDKINDVSLDFPKDGKQVIVSSISSDIGENTVDLEANISGDDNSIVVNYSYILDGLRAINSDQIEINVVNNDTPCLIKSTDNNNYIYIVMPIKQ